MKNDKLGTDAFVVTIGESEVVTVTSSDNGITFHHHGYSFKILKDSFNHLNEWLESCEKCNIQTPGEPG